MFKRREQCEDCENYFYNVDEDIHDTMETECTHEYNQDTDESCPIFSPKNWWVNVYLQDRAYGGSEEGGWWYDIGEVKTGILCYGNSEAEEIRNQMKEVCEMWNEDRYPISSVLSDGQYYVYIEEEPPKDWPDSFPHYE